eukprot:4354206-Amphidinium_carterae.3
MARRTLSGDDDTVIASTNSVEVVVMVVGPRRPVNAVELCLWYDGVTFGGSRSCRCRCGQVVVVVDMCGGRRPKLFNFAVWCPCFL